jgi:hypothetical protein
VGWVEKKWSVTSKQWSVNSDSVTSKNRD